MDTSTLNKFKTFKISLERYWDLVAILIYATLATISFHKVLVTSGLLYQGDLTPPVSIEQAISAIKRYSSPWDNFYITGRFNPSFSSVFVFYSLLFFLSSLLGSVEHGICTLLVLTLAGSGFTMYYATKCLERNRKASFVAGLIYMLNPWVYDRLVSGHILFLLAYLIFPLSFICFIRSFESEMRVEYSIMSGVFLAIILVLQFHLAYLAFFSMFLFVLISIVHDLKNSYQFTKICKKYMLNIASLFATAILLNMWWFYPSLAELSKFGATFQTPLSALGYTQQRITLINTLRLSSNWLAFYDRSLTDMVGGYSVFFVIGSIVLTILPLTIPLLYRYKDKKYTFYFWTLAAIGIVLGMGTKGLGTFFIWLISNVPLFFIFDDPNKFLFLTIFAISFLIAILLTKIKEKRYHTFVVMIITFLILGNALPYYTGNFNNQLAPLTIPQEIKDAVTWLVHEGDGRIALLPPWASVRFDWSQKNIVNPLLVHPPLPAIILPYTPGVQEASPQEEYVRWAFMMLYLNRTSFAGKLFSPLGVNYFLWMADADSERRDDLWWIDNGNIKSILQGQKDLKLVNKIGSVYVFKNLDTLPEVYVAKQPILVIGDRSAIISLSYLENFDFKLHPLIFVQQLSPPELRKILRNSDLVILQPHHLYDLPFALLDEQYLINVEKYAVNPFTTSNYAWFVRQGRMINEPTKWVYLTGDQNLAIPVNVDTPGEMEIWAKVYTGPEQGSIQIKIGELNKIINPHALTEQGFMWTKIGEANLSKGEHEILIQHEGAENAISQIAILPKGTLEFYVKEAMSLLRDLTPMIISEGEEADYGGRVATKVGSDASNGFSLTGTKGQSSGYIFVTPKEGSYNIAFRAKTHQEKVALMSITIDCYAFEADETFGVPIVKDSQALNGYSVYRSVRDGSGVYVCWNLGKSLPVGKYDLYVRIRSAGGIERSATFYQVNEDLGQIIQTWSKIVSSDSYTWLKVGSFLYNGTYNLRISDWSSYGLYVDTMIITPSLHSTIQKYQFLYQLLPLDSSEFKWVETSAYLTQGTHMLNIESSEGTSIDLIIIYPSNFDALNHFVRHFDDKENVTEIQVTSSLMSYEIRAIQPLSMDACLVVLNSYDRSWVAKNGGFVYYHIEVWSYANAFCAEAGKNENTVNIQHRLLYHYNVGILVSVIFIILVVVAFTWERVKNKNTEHSK
jgi:hypothetical protein